jgi:hypothetical protein
VADAWPLIDDDPDVAYWAAEFLASGHAAAMA